MNRVISESKRVRSQSAKLSGSRKICIVTAELAGPFYNGGIGTANRALALALRRLGCAVDILYTRIHEGRPFSSRGDFGDHVKAFQKLGINLMCVDERCGRDDWQTMSYFSLQHLLRNQYDLVFFDDLFGTGYYPLLARRTGNMHLRDTKMCVTAHAPLQWIADLDQVPIGKIGDLRWGEMERRCCELADAIRAPSAYILKKYRSYGWAIPENSIVLPNFVSSKQLNTPPIRRAAVREFVFFGRLETRKGLWMFCRALDRLKYRLSGCVITFLGKEVVEKGISTVEILLRRSAAWPFLVRFLTNFDQEQALSYLKRPGRLAIIASPEDNSPSTILECVEEGIPFLACSGSGGEELLHETSRKENLVEPSVEGLCTKLLDVFEHGAVTGRASFNQEQLQVRFAEWLDGLLSFPSAPVEVSPERARTNPILMVIVPAEFYADLAVSELRRAVQAFEQKVTIQVLAAEPVELQKRQASSSELLPINVVHINDFERITQSLAAGESTVIGLCHITQLLTPAWVERARICFGINGVSAATGMVAITQARDPHVRQREPYISVANEGRQIDRYLMGFTPPLFPLAQETNSGFVLMRSEVLEKCSRISPLDQEYNRLKRMQDWIHEILVTLYEHGVRFEVVPDLVVDQPVREAEFEAFPLEGFMRSLPSKLFGIEPGTDQSALARLAIDTSLEHERSRAHANYVQNIKERIGVKILQLPRGLHWEEQARELAMIAHASGQIDLAIDLCAGLTVSSEVFKHSKITDYVQTVAAGKIVDLVESLADRHSEFGEKGKKQILGTSDKRVIEMHTSAAGPTGFVLPSLNLTKITHFTTILAVPEQSADSVRFRIELHSQDGEHWFAENVVSGGNENVWEFECPDGLRTACSVRLGVELVNWQNPRNTITQWISPIFISRR
jgi:glycosyltransferase involved in cell wall biosynthesis